MFTEYWYRKIFILTLFFQSADYFSHSISPTQYRRIPIIADLVSKV